MIIHFDELSCLLYLEGELDAARALELASHAEQCHTCNALLTSLERETRLLHKTFTEDALEIDSEVETAPTVPTWLWTTCLLSIAGGGVTLWVDWIRPLLNGFSGYGIDTVELFSSTAFNVFFSKEWSLLGQAVEAVAMLMVGMMVVGLLRGLRLRNSASTIGMGCLALLLVQTPQARAQVTRGEFYSLPAGQTVDHDLVLQGKDLQINGTVDGDVFAFAHSLTVNGHVNGDVIAFTQYLTVNGEVDGDVRTFSQVLQINGTVQHAASAFVNRLEIGPPAKVGRQVMIFADSLDNQGQLGRGIWGRARTTQLGGTVAGNIHVKGHEFRLMPGAVVQGRLWFSGTHAPIVDSLAKVNGGVEFHELHHVSPWRTWQFYWHQALRWATAFLVGVLLLVLFPFQVRNTLQATRQVAWTFGVGAVATVATPLLVVIAALTMVGLAAGAITLTLYAIALYLAEVLTGFWLGQQILGRLLHTGRSAWVTLALGLAFLRIGVNLPWVGNWVLLAAFIFGLGAQARALGTAWSNRRKHNGATPGWALRDPLRLET